MKQYSDLSRKPLVSFLLICVLFGFCLACDDTQAPTNVMTDMAFIGPDRDVTMEPMGQCPWPEDGICDEPHACALGSDQVDCEIACAENNVKEELEAVCLWYQMTVDGELGLGRQVGRGSLGTGGAYGHVSGLLLTPSGEDPNRDVARHYRAFIPRSYQADTPMPLLLMLPGHRVAVDPLAEYTQLIASADQEGFIVVFAEQEVRSADQRWAWWTDWPWSQRPDAQQHPDLIFLDSLVEQFKSTYNIDQSRVYVSGHSRGASMALIAALERPDLFAAAVSQSGFTEFGYEQRLINRDPALPTPSILLLHGDLDPDVCIDCRPGAQCAVTGRNCGSIYGSDALAEIFNEQGWTEANFRYYRLQNVTHRWQPQLNASIWSWLKQRPLANFEQENIARTLHWPSQATVGELSANDDKPARAPLISDENMISFPMASFEMGNPVESPQPYGDGWFMDQTPINLIRLDPFKLDRTEVTVSDYAVYLNHVGLAKHYHSMMPIQPQEGGYTPYLGSENLPMSGVSWTEAQAYCAWRGKRLPSEAELEFVTTGGGRRAYPWTSDGGARCHKAIAFIGAAQCESDTQAVGLRNEGDSPEGLADLIGNVAEWTNSPYQAYPGNEEQGAWLSLDEPIYAVRGGGLFNSGSWLTGRTRWSATASARGQALGFRCAMSEDGNMVDEYKHSRGLLATRRTLSASHSPLNQAQMTGQRIIGGLRAPIDVEKWLNGLVISEKDLDQIVFIEPEQGELSILIPNIPSPSQLASQSDRLLIATDGALLEWSEQSLNSVYETTEPIEALVADELDSFWLSSGQLFRQARGGEVEVVAEMGTDFILTLSPDRLIISSKGPKSSNSPIIWALDRLQESSSPTILLTQSDLPNGFGLYGLDFAPNGGLSLAIRQGNWPYVGRICQLDPSDTQLSCFSDSPPQVNDLKWVADELYWTSKRAVLNSIELNGVSTYSVISQWHAPSLLSEDQGQLIWLNQLTGSLWMGD